MVSCLFFVLAFRKYWTSVPCDPVRRTRQTLLVQFLRCFQRRICVKILKSITVLVVLNRLIQEQPWTLRLAVEITSLQFQLLELGSGLVCWWLCLPCLLTSHPDTLTPLVSEFWLSWAVYSCLVWSLLNMWVDSKLPKHKRKIILDVCLVFLYVFL